MLYNIEYILKLHLFINIYKILPYVKTAYQKKRIIYLQMIIHIVFQHVHSSSTQIWVQ